MKKPLKCNPNNTNLNYSCISNIKLIKLAKAYNKKFPDDKIEIPKKFNRANFYKEVKDKINKWTKCSNELCWLNKVNFKKLRNKIKISRDFLPFKPEDWKTNLWLSTKDINNVVHRFSVNSTTKYIGVSK